MERKQLIKSAVVCNLIGDAMEGTFLSFFYVCRSLGVYKQPMIRIHDPPSAFCLCFVIITTFYV